MKLGLYGGSFDPVHTGHVAPVLAARDRLRLDRVVYLPTARPPHKRSRELASGLHRYAMVELALLDHPDLIVSPFELTPGATAFTVETVRHFRALHPDAELHLLIGADSLERIDTYREWEEIVASVRLGVLTRPGWDLDEVLAALPRALRERAASGLLTAIENPPVEPSSTRLREMLGDDLEPPEGWMNPRVLQYARKYRLYR